MRHQRQDDAGRAVVARCAGGIWPRPHRRHREGSNAHADLGGRSWSSEECQAILNYCESDVAALAHLLPAMLPRIDLPRALLRGRYMAAAAAMEHNGVPIDRPML